MGKIRLGLGPAIGAALGFLASSSVFAQTARASDSEPIEERNKAAVLAGFEAWRNGSGSPYDLLADDAQWTIVGNSAASRLYTSKEDFLVHVIRPFNARMQARLIPSIRDVYADEDTVVVFFDARGTARDGKPYANTYAWFLTLTDGRIVRAFAFFDSVAFDDLWTRVSPES